MRREKFFKKTLIVFTVLILLAGFSTLTEAGVEICPSTPSDNSPSSNSLPVTISKNDDFSFLVFINYKLNQQNSSVSTFLTESIFEQPKPNLSFAIKAKF